MNLRHLVVTFSVEEFSSISLCVLDRSANLPPLCLLPNWPGNIFSQWDNGLCTVGRAVTFDTREPRFESSHRSFLLEIELLLGKLD